MRVNFSIIVFILVFMSSLILAQGYDITGKVTDAEDGSPLAGTNILVKGTTVGTSSDAQGNYKLTIPENLQTDILVFSFIGYETREVAIEGKKVIDVQMAVSSVYGPGLVVTGIRGSIKKALESKRESVNVSDVINSEDVGKLPDQNIAEALQRVTGVAIQRSRGEGDFVSLRGLGPDFVRGTINGRTLVSATESRDATISGGVTSSTGRATNFDVLPSEVISTLTVTKSTSAQQVEGGIGGVVDIGTARPLTIGNQRAISAQGEYREFNQDFDPTVSGLYSWVSKDGSLGALGSVAYSQRSIREDFNRSFGYAKGSLFGAATSYDTDLDGTEDVGDIWVPFSNNLGTYDETRKRLTLQGTIQKQFSNQSEINLDALYSKRDVEHLENEVQIGTDGVFLSSVMGNGVTNADGSIQVPNLVVGSNTAQKFNFTSALDALTDLQKSGDELLSLGLNYKKQLADWKLDADVNYATAEGTTSFNRSSLATTQNIPYSLDISGGKFVVAQTGGPDISDLSIWETNNADVISRTNNDQETSIALNAKREINSGILSAVRTGARVRFRDKDVKDHTNFIQFGESNGARLPASPVKVFHIENFFNGDIAYPYASLPFPDIDSHRAYVAQNTDIVFEAPFSPQNSYKIGENTFAAYVQLDLKGAIGNVPFTGDVGFRMVHTRQDVTGYSRPFTIVPVTADLSTVVYTGDDIEELPFESQYTNVLPAMNLKFELSNDLYLRAATSKSLTRPTFQQLAPALDINASQATAVGGNPELEAFESTNYDLGMEWYFKEASALYADMFYKKIGNFVGPSTNFNVEVSDAVFTSIVQPDNQGQAEISGLELGYQHAFKTGFGYQLNATFIASSAKYVDGLTAGQDIPFEGVSDLSYNLTGYYENHGFQARAAYSFRSEFVLPGLSRDVFGNRLIADDYGQMDASISYQFFTRYSVFFNAINILDTEARIFSDISERPLSLSHIGRCFSSGLRVGF